MKHFLQETSFTHSEMGEIFDLARNFKKQPKPTLPLPLEGETWALLFFKNSTRTRVSFEVGINELGGHPLYLAQNTMQLSRGESWGDTAQVLSRYVHGLIIRTFAHEIIEAFAEQSSIPVINALTDLVHPCQSYSDAFTMAERWSPEGPLLKGLEGRKIAFLGDCACNMANSLILMANLCGMTIALAGPREYAPGETINTLLQKKGFSDPYTVTEHALEAAEDADVIYTDVWVSMGKEEETALRIEKMKPYTVSRELLQAAKPDALFMHCLPAHPGMEVTQEVLDSPKSIIFDQAENRLHVQKAILSLMARKRNE